VTITLWALSVITQAGLVARLWKLNLLRRYPWFSFFLCTALLRSIYLVSINKANGNYLRAYTGTEPILVFALIAFSIEAYWKSMEAYPRLGSFGAWFLLICIGLAAALNLRLDSDVTLTAWKWHDLYVLNIVRRWTLLVVGIAMWVTLIFLHWLPAPARRNVVIHQYAATAYLTIKALGLLMVNFTDWRGTPLNLLELGGSSACYVAWTVLLARQGEVQPQIEQLTRPQAGELARIEGALKRLSESR
jgi:hypothetical protein